MSVPAAAIISARRARIIEVIDARARTIGVRRIVPSERWRLTRAAADDADVVFLLCAAAVAFVESDGVRRTCAPEAREPVLWAMASTLGDEGMAAVTYALWQHAVGPAGSTPSHHPFRLPALMPAVHAAASDALAMQSGVSVSRITVSAPPEAILPLFFKP